MGLGLRERRSKGYPLFETGTFLALQHFKWWEEN
jgi:hypothetical protein